MTKELGYIMTHYKILPSKKPQVEIADMDRKDLAILFNLLGYRKGVEIGVFKGEYSRVLLESNKFLRLYGVDPYMAYEDYEDPEPHKEYMEKALKIYSKHNCQLIRKTSMEAVKQFEDNSLDFVYIDGNHIFPYVAEDIHWWTKKVRIGGIVSGHDYTRSAHFKVDGERPRITHQVVEAVNGYMSANYIDPWFVIGRRSIMKGEKRDRIRSWFFVKEYDY